MTSPSPQPTLLQTASAACLHGLFMVMLIACALSSFHALHVLYKRLVSLAITFLFVQRQERYRYLPYLLPTSRLSEKW
jgi:hypothetical protein